MDIHAASVFRGVAGDFSAVYGECGFIVNVSSEEHAAAVFGCSVVGDRAGVHGERNVSAAVDIGETVHAAAIACYLVMGNCSAVHNGTRRTSVVVHAAAASCGIVCDRSVFDGEGFIAI